MRKRFTLWCLLAVMTAMGMSAWALDKKDGAYQIGSLEDYLAFASLVNTPVSGGGEPAANAVLTADIDLGTDGTMIGTESPDYFQGAFDGQGHTIKVNAYPAADSYGIFFRLQKNAEVRNLRVQATVTTNNTLVGGLAANTMGAYIHNCVVECTVNAGKAGDNTHGGVVARTDRGTFISDCLVRFTVNGASATNCGGVVGWAAASTTVQNCVVINETNMSSLNGSGTLGRNAKSLASVDLKKYAGGARPTGACYDNFAVNSWGDNTSVTVVGADGLKDGAVCYQLNSDQSRIQWTQEIGKDDCPMPAPFGSGRQVYASAATDCHGHVAEGTEVTYSNSATASTPARHELDRLGICPQCGYFDYRSLPFDSQDRCLVLSSDKDFWLAEGLNTLVGGTTCDMRMAADVSLSVEGEYLFDNTAIYSGTFDGQGHELTINFTKAPVSTSLFPQLQGKVRNLVMHGLISGTDKKYASVAAYSKNSLIENVYSDMRIETTNSGDVGIGGISGASDLGSIVRNCIYNGTIAGSKASGTKNCAGLVGWCSNRTSVMNCAFTGEIVDVQGDVWSVARKVSNLSPVNVYYKNEYVPQGSKIEGATRVSPDAVASGELAFLLNQGVQGCEGRFYQTLPSDQTPYPVALNHGKVYAQAPSYLCDGTPQGAVTYTNSPIDVAFPDHQFDHGVCAVCCTPVPDYLKPAQDGWYELKDGHDLTWWSNYAGKVNLGAKARLVADIEMTDDDNARYAVVGTEQEPFYGSFDGQFHRISNLVINHDQLGVGLIAVMNSEPQSPADFATARGKQPVVIRDVILDQSCSLTGQGYVGLIGMTSPWGGNILVQNVGMEGNVTATSRANASGVLGCVMLNECKVTIDNSFMAGNVYGPSQNAAFSGWLGAYATVSNCYAIGTVENPDKDRYFARFSGTSVTIKNCFTRNGGALKLNDKEVVSTVSDADIASGALAYRANGSTSVNPRWYQNLDGVIDEHPVPVPTHGTVFRLASKYMSAANADEQQQLVDAIEADASDYAENTVAEKAVVDRYVEAASALADLATIPEVAQEYVKVLLKKDTANVSAGKYKAYMTEMAKVRTTLAEHDDFEGKDRELLEKYFESSDEPNEDWPLGGYLYIIDEMLAPSDSLAGEIVRVNQALETAIKNGYMPGTDVTGLLANADFLSGNTAWKGIDKVGIAVRKIGDKSFAGAERYAGSLDMTQTIEGLKPGYYKLEVPGATRPCTDRYGLNYIGTLDVNGTTNYFMADIEDVISVDDAIDQVNCNLTGGTNDYPVIKDHEATGDTIGYIMHGPIGVAYATNAGRYKNYILGHVGEDGRMTVRIRQDSTGYSSDWIGFGAMRLTYCGETDDEQMGVALDDVLNSQMARATTILEDYVPDGQVFKRAPSFPASLRTALAAAVNEAAAAGDNAAKLAAVEKLSDLFLQIREAKTAYAHMACMVSAMYEAAGKVSDELGDGEYTTITNKCEDALEPYVKGEYTLEEAQTLKAMDEPEFQPFLPATRGDTLLISDRKRYAFFSAYVGTVSENVCAELTADISNVTDIMAVDGAFRGTLDGKFHTIDLNMDNGSATNLAVFKYLYGTVKNLNITGTINVLKFGSSVASHAYLNASIDRVSSSVTINSTNTGDGTHGGIIAVAESGCKVNVSNTLFSGSINGASTKNCGGFIGWSGGKTALRNCLQIADMTVLATGGHTWSRKPDNCTLTNCYYLKAFATTAGTQTTTEKMASGELCYALNGSTTLEPAWFQTLGTDAAPHVTPGDVVYYYGRKYTNVEPSAQLNSYASQVNVKSDADQVVVSYLLNAPAQEGEIRFYNGSEVAHTETLTTADLTVGTHEVTVSNSSLPAAGTALTFDVKVKSYGATDPMRVGATLRAYDPYGMAVMNDPESTAFGNIYLTESDGNDAGYGAGTSDAGYISDAKHSALYMLTPTFQVVNAADGTPGWKGGMTDGARVVAVDNDAYAHIDYKNVRASQDGRLFVSRISGMSDSPIYEVNPDNMEEPWTPVFTGTIDKQTGITYVGEEEQARMNVSFDLAGKGDQLQLLALGVARSNGSFNYTDYRADLYALGTAKQWTKAPTANFTPLTGKYTIAPMPVNVLSDQRGGAWYVQFRSSPNASTPAIKHFNAQGVEDFSDTSTSLASGGCALSQDGTMLAVASGNSIIIYTTNYEPLPNGQIFLSPIYNFTHQESSISAMAFDYAGNLVVAGRTSATVARYVVPSQTDNITVTPASSRCAFKVGEVKTGIDQIATESGDQKVYNLQGIRLQKAEKGVNIINGRKVMVK